MAGFRLVQDGNEATGTEQWLISSLALHEGDLVELDAGATAATAGDSSTVAWQRKGISMEETTISSTTVKVTPINEDQIWEATSNANSSRGHNNDRMVMTGTWQVNNSGTDSVSGICIQLGPVGAAADKRILVKFLNATGGTSL